MHALFRSCSICAHLLCDSRASKGCQTSKKLLHWCSKQLFASSIDLLWFYIRQSLVVPGVSRFRSCIFRALEGLFYIERSASRLALAQADSHLAQLPPARRYISSPNLADNGTRPMNQPSATVRRRPVHLTQFSGSAIPSVGCGSLTTGRRLLYGAAQCVREIGIYSVIVLWHVWLFKDGCNL